MKARGAAIAFAILLGGVGFLSEGAEARTTDARQANKPSRAAAAPATNRPAAAPARTTTPSRTAAAPARASADRQADATRRGSVQRGRNGAVQTVSIGRSSRVTAFRGGGGGGGISCVPYARQATGMAISGNGRDWWYNAAGLYARGNRPEVGSVMAFPGSGGMRAGHVAVVEQVVSNREVLIHHANWGGPGIRRGSIMRGVSVIDVSPANDWTQVRVQVGHSSENYGRPYPVYGFIHNRPDPTGGTMLAGGTAPLRVNAAQAASLSLEEVAQAPAPRR
ncbi:CHAP domain-containing protein [Neoroseomonas rubea]|uniref:CHAP domain-containing protein n=1 Tax=Neoroseomonas rubea TaxID=2748666 RepID=UPI0018DFEF58|nr:CHAP domain-containing protein [Roseomonas rubea]